MTPTPTRCSQDTAANQGSSNSTIRHACCRSPGGHHVSAIPELGAGAVKARSRARVHARSVRSAEALYGAEHSSTLACVMVGGPGDRGRHHRNAEESSRADPRSVNRREDDAWLECRVQDGPGFAREITSPQAQV